jgi:hypothetical protein
VPVERNATPEQFARLCSDLPGQLVIAVIRGVAMQPLVLGEDGPFHAWSTIKVPVAAALLNAVHRDRLAPKHHDLIRLAITESDNPAIVEPFALLEGLSGGPYEAAAGIERLFRLSGDLRSIVALDPPPPGAITPFGQTEWATADAASFFSALATGRLLSVADMRHLLDLMEGVVAEQRWGLGGLGPGIAFKGGWGPEADGSCLVRQTGVLVASGVASSLTANLRPVPTPSSRAC